MHCSIRNIVFWFTLCITLLDFVLQLQQLLVPANLVQVAYGASSSRLENREDHPNFLRTNPSNSRGAANLVKVLKKLTSSNKIAASDVFTISTDSEYGKTGKEVFIYNSM